MLADTNDHPRQLLVSWTAGARHLESRSARAPYAQRAPLRSRMCGSSGGVCPRLDHRDAKCL